MEDTFHLTDKGGEKCEAEGVNERGGENVGRFRPMLALQ